MQAAQAANTSYGGHSYPHTYEHHIIMDRGWPGQQTGQQKPHQRILAPARVTYRSS